MAKRQKANKSPEEKVSLFSKSESAKRAKKRTKLHHAQNPGVGQTDEYPLKDYGSILPAAGKNG